MPDESQSLTRLEKTLEQFRRHGVEIIVIGGQAQVLHGGLRPTYDVDLCYSRTDENIEKLAAALAEIHPSLRGAPPDLPFRADANALSMGSNFTFDTDLGPLDLLGWVEPIGGYDQVLAHAEWYELNGLRIATISLDDLIRIKEHIGRPKDQAALVELRAIRDERERGS